MPGERSVHVDAQHTFRLRTGKGAFGILDIRKDAQAALVIGLTVERGRPVSSAAKVKLRRSTTRQNTRMASNRSILFVRQSRIVMPIYG